MCCSACSNDSTRRAEGPPTRPQRAPTRPGHGRWRRVTSRYPDPRWTIGPVGAVLELLAPARCLACRRRLPGGAPWCDPCDRDAVAAPLPACQRCGGPRNAGHGCWPPEAPIASTVIAFDYRGPVAAAVVAAKVGGGTAAWPGLGERLGARVAAEPPAVDVVCWVATAPSRARRRGVDHAAVLAHAVARALEVPAAPLLRWHRAWGGVEEQRPAGHLPGTSVLLVDDVLTTGATAVAAAWALVGAGAGEVHLAVLARAGDHALVPGDARGVRISGRTGVASVERHRSCDVDGPAPRRGRAG